MSDEPITPNAPTVRDPDMTDDELEEIEDHKLEEAEEETVRDPDTEDQ